MNIKIRVNINFNDFISFFYVYVYPHISCKVNQYSTLHFRLRKKGKKERERKVLRAHERRYVSLRKMTESQAYT